MKLIVGIGNPEKKYDNTRHNIGFQVLDALRKKPESREVLLIKPDTYVNRTGEAAAALAKKHDAKPSDFLFVCDDVNLAFGKLRLRASGSAGGHHGLESVIEAFGSGDFPRLRIGVGNETMPQDNLTEYVLGKFSADEKKELGSILEKAVSVCIAWAEHGFDRASNELSRQQSTHIKESSE